MLGHEVDSCKTLIKTLKDKLRTAVNMVINQQKHTVSERRMLFDSFTIYPPIVAKFECRVEKLEIENKNLRSVLQINQDFNSFKHFDAEYAKLELEMRKKSDSKDLADTTDNDE